MTEPRNEIAIERSGKIVTVTVQLVCSDDYAAIEMADGIKGDATAGHVMLDFQTAEQPASQDRPAESPWWICPACGKRNRPDATRCVRRSDDRRERTLCDEPRPADPDGTR